MLMVCPKFVDHELLELEEKELRAVPQAFSGGQRCVSR